MAKTTPTPTPTPTPAIATTPARRKKPAVTVKSLERERAGLVTKLAKVDQRLEKLNAKIAAAQARA